VDDLGNQFSIQAFRVTDFCPLGFVSGRWAPTSPGHGVFRGRWTSRYGLSHGWLKGHWGTDSNGKQVFFGKYIGQGGEFRGLLRGHWDHTTGRPGGTFVGRWHDGNGVAGGLRGVWNVPPRRGNDTAAFQADDFTGPGRNGFFHGKWHANCDGSIEDDSSDFEDESDGDQAKAGAGDEL